MIFKFYDTLPQAAADIRKEVFVYEQGFKDEFDSVDSGAIHMLVFDADEPIATCRFYPREDGGYLIGRIAVRREYRGKGIGAEILRAAETRIRELGADLAFIHAQVRAEGFYRKQGYMPFGGQDLDEGQPHIWMKKSL